MNHRTTLHRWSHSAQAPLWVSIALDAAARAGESGQAVYEPGELRTRFATTQKDVSRAITRAVYAGWLDPSSTSYRLVVAHGA